MLKIDKQKLKHNKMPTGLLLVESVLAILVIYLFYKILGFEFSFATKAFTLAPAPDPVLLFFFVLCAALLVATYFAIKKRSPVLFEAQKKAPSTIKAKTREKLSKAKNEPRAAALLLIEFIFVFAIVLTIVAWLDPELELIPWTRAGILPPMTTALNAIIALIALGFFYYIYSFTAWYRKGAPYEKAKQ